MTLPRARRIAVDHPDVVLLAAWWVLVVALGFARKDFTGDGVRHLLPVIAGNGPSVGESRWLLFPGFMYLLWRPFVLLGIVHDAEGLTRAMMAATVIAAGVYTLALRDCLRSLGVSPVRRAAALAVAVFSTGLFVPATDLMEPIFGATLIVCGLAFAARRANDPGATDEQRRRGVYVAAAAVAAATPLYQGLVLGIGLIPLVVPTRVWRDRRALVGAGAIVAASLVLMWVILVLDGRTLAQGFKQLLRGADNPGYATFNKKSGPMQFVVALVAGPPQGLIGLGQFHGFNGLIADLRTPGARSAALEVLVRLAIGGAIFFGGLWVAIRRRDQPLLIGIAFLLVLTVLRRQQYGYIKFWILLPVLLAFAASRAAPWMGFTVAAAFAALNVPGLVAYVPESNRSYQDHMQAYAHADARSCWYTGSWVPPFWFRWPGKIVPVLGTLSEGSGDDPKAIMAASRANMTKLLRQCFCESSGVFTDDMIAPNRASLVETATHFGYDEIDLTGFLLADGQGTALSRTRPTVWAYPKDLQDRLCQVASAPPATR